MTDQQRTDRRERAGTSPPADTSGRNETETEREGREAEELLARDLDELAEARRERDEYLELAQRTKADFENYRKRVAKDTSEALVRGKADLARQLLPALDNLERALEASGDDARARDSATRLREYEALVEGVALVRDELHSRLEGAGVEAFDPTGEKFDPQLHEALATKPDERIEPGVILETVEKGYRLNGQVLRAAKVVVSQ
jgi:molecular chaperone GrpE